MRIAFVAVSMVAATCTHCPFGRLPAGASTETFAPDPLTYARCSNPVSFTKSPYDRCGYRPRSTIGEYDGPPVQLTHASMVTAVCRRRLPESATNTWSSTPSNWSPAPVRPVAQLG